MIDEKKIIQATNDELTTKERRNLFSLCTVYL